MNAAFEKGGLIATGLGAFFGVATLVASVLHVVEHLWLPCAFAFLACASSFYLYRQARRGCIGGRESFGTFLGLMLLPTVFFVVSQVYMPAGAATYITGPFSYLYFLFIALTGFLFNPRLSCAAGLVSAVGYLLSFSLAHS